MKNNPQVFLSFEQSIQSEISSACASLVNAKVFLVVVFFFFLTMLPVLTRAQAAASSNYTTQTGTLGTTYSWIDCSAGTSITTGDDVQGSFSWPFTFSFYDNTYTTSNSISVATNGFIRLDGTASTAYGTAQDYTLSSTSTELGQIIATSVYDCNVGGIGSSWIKYLVTGTAPNRILTVEYSDIEINYSAGKYAKVQVSFYEMLNKVVLKLGTDNVTQAGADMGIHSGVSGYYNKWQEVTSGTNNAWIEYTPTSVAPPPTGPAASWNYDIQTGTIGSTYGWINCSSGTSIVNGDDAQALINWPFNFNFYDNAYTTTNSLSVATNGFIRFDGMASTDYNAASSYVLSSSATSLGQILALAVYDGNVSGTGYIKYLVAGNTPNRIFTIEYNDLQIDYNDGKYADVEVSFYESSNKIVLKLGTENINKSGADMGLHSGVNGYFNKWQEVNSATNNTWIEYTPPYIEVDATIGTSIAYYPTLKAAFDQVNNGTHQGIITVKIKHSTTEAVSAVLNASGTGSANYASVKIYPTATGLSINGNMYAPLIDLDGADNVIIDGRVNATGSAKDLIIDNTSVNASPGTSTIRFINDASTNTVKYCTIKGSGVSSENGVITFATTTGSNGNDANTINNNNITNSADANRPVNAVYSLGTSGKDNSGNTISNNNIYDFLRPASSSNGIYLSANNNTWIINGNSFYETTPFASTGTFTYYAIQINNTSGNEFNVLNNYIGGTAPQCGGAAFTKTNARSNPFNAIYLNVGTTTASSVQNNTIQNFNWSNLTNDTWTAINIAGGDVNIGTTTGNTIGKATGTGSISVTGTSNGQNVYGINIAGSGTVNCSNNTIASFVVANANSAYASHFTGINTTNTGIINLSNNTIGNISQANSINVSSASTSYAQSVYGIRNTAAGSITIDNNTIANLNNATTNTNTSTLGLISGIASGSGINTITNNKISSLYIANANTTSLNSASVTGIAITSSSTLTTISGNTIYNLSNLYNSFAGSVIGLYFGTSGTSNTVTANFIYGLTITGTSATSASIYGIKINTGQTTYANNIISLGGNTATTIYGIYETGTASNNNSIYFNTLYIFGSLGSGIANKSYALFSNASTNVRNFRNNIFMNARSTVAGSNLHYAAYFNYSTSTNLTLNYNDYFVSGTGGVIGYYESANKTTLPIVTGQDANSLNTNPVFANAGGANYLDYKTSAALPGVFGTGILVDYEIITRNNPPKMGALESTLAFTWQGNTSTNFATATNWVNGIVPPNGVDISFAATPTNDCYLDQNRTLKKITNASAKKFVVNGKQLTLTGTIASATTNQIDATAASSVVIFAGTAAQIIPSGVFVSNTIDGITLNNSLGLIQNGAIIVPTSLTLTNGAYTIGANTLTLNGAVSTTSGTLTGGGTSNIVIGGSGSTTILPAVVVKNLTLNRANGISTGGDITVAGTLVLNNGTLTLGANTLTISGNSPTVASGSINADNTASTIVFSNSSAILLPASIFTGNINNLTINGSGITAVSDLTINGVLNLQSANPSAIKGSLDMSTYTLYMGGSATTIGIGDVTGIVRREHTFVQNSSYSFGNQYTTFTFNDNNLKPTWISLKITIGSVAPWSPWSPSPNGKVKRLYQVASSENASTSAASINMRYLLSELDATYNDESQLVFWHKFITYGGGLPHEHGKSNQDFTNHFIGVTGLILGAATSSNLDDSQVAIAYSVNAKNTWKGEVGGHQTEWEQAQNWTAGHVPLSTEDVLIPDGLTYYPSLTASANAVANTIEIHTGASISANSYNITVSGAGGAWINNGTFNPGTGKVFFNHGVLAETVTVAGITNFYDIEVGVNTTMQPVAGCVLRIAGIGSADMTSVVDFSSINNTVDWNGSEQTIVNPNGIGGSSGYYNLILSGSGTKTMPVTAMNIAHDFFVDGTVTATAASSLTIGGELEIYNGATFASGNYDHSVAENFDNAGIFIPSSGTTITLNGTSEQIIYGATETIFEKLNINNPAGVTLNNNTTVNNTLILTSGNLNVGANTLTIGGEVDKTDGLINVSIASSLTFEGTSTFSPGSSIFTSPPNINNLTINRTLGIVVCCDFTVNGVLNLQSANPSDIIGTLDMGTNSLNMGATATTTGSGDVTGIVKRTTILPNIEYTFGHQFTSVTFPNIGTLPTEISAKISIGTVPSWGSSPDYGENAVKRIYEIAQVGGDNTSATIKAHYLDSELNGNDEQILIDLSYVIPYGIFFEEGRSDINTTDNWISLNNNDFGYFPSSFGVMQLGFREPSTNVITWDGSVSSDWDEETNWTPALRPDPTKIVVIPNAATTPNDPLLPAHTTINTLSILTGGILNSGASSELTLVGATGAWVNNGTFNAATGKVIFNNGLLSKIVTIAGTTDFYDITVEANTTLQPVSGSIVRIAGAGSADMTSQVDFSTINNTVEWNGVNQIIVKPYGIGSNSGFYNLILSGSGTKTMPTSALTIHGNFTVSGTASATAADSIIVLGNTTIGLGSTFSTGSHHHLFSGNLINNGTFTPTSGGVVSFNGTSAQAISGTSTTSFDNLTIENLLGVALESNINVNNVLTFNNGNLSVGANTLGINGAVSNPSGNIEVNNTSSLSFGGTSAITLNNYLFNGNPTINNLTINRSGGVTIGNESVTVNGTLTLTSGTLSIAAKTLTLAGNSPIRTSGNIDASHASAYLVFENTTAITLPASLFSGNVNNMTINGAGGISAAGDFTLDGILNLQSTNPSATKGSLDMSSYTLTMGANATTIGPGDVTGIIKRTSISSNTTYTMGNQYTTVYFPNVGILPTQMSVKVVLGAAPSWRTGAVERVYDFIQTGGSGTEAVLQSHYLDSELNGNDENKLVEWMHIYTYPLTIEYGRSNYNTNDNWVSVSHVNVSAYSSVFGAIQMIVDEYQLADLTWNGSTSTSWVTATNWTPQGAPSDQTVVTIPDAATTTYDPSIPATAICGKMIIEIGGILNSVSDGQLTVTGANGAWANNGTFEPGTGTVIFANGNEAETVTISGTNSFHNLIVTNKTHLQPAINSIINIAGDISNANGNGILDFSSNPNTVNFNGGKQQYVVNPGGGYGYYHLTFSENGLIVLPESTLKILGNLSIDAPISATGNTILMAGTNAQNISGATAATLNNLTIDNTSGVTLTNTATTTISGVLQINSGKKFEIAAAQKLTVSGSITNSAGIDGFIVKSDATGTASLIHNSDNVAATVQRYISGADEAWHFLSSPVVSQPISGSWLPSGTYGNLTGYDLYVWNEPTNCWIYKLNTTPLTGWDAIHPGANFTVGRGYLYSVQAENPTKEFTGNLNKGNVTYGLTIDGSADATLQGFNLVGNPYPSSIDWTAATGWSRSNLVSSGSGYDMWIWNPAVDNYGVCNSATGIGTNGVTQNIAPMQGFFVRAYTDGSLGMDNVIRTHAGADAWFKEAGIEELEVSIKVSSDAENTADEALLLFGYTDNENGASKLFSHVLTAPSLYMQHDGDDYSVRYLTDTVDNPTVPVMFKPGQDGTYTISCNFNTSEFGHVTLEDRQMQHIQDMKLESTYHFIASKKDEVNRFVLHFGAEKENYGNKLPAQIYTNGQQLIIDLSSVQNETNILVYDVLGRLMIQKTLQGSSLHTLKINSPPQVLIVKLINPQGYLTRKVFYENNN